MHPGRREWDAQMLNSCLYPHDVEEVRKIRLSDRGTEDVIAWHYEKTGLFTVKSVYTLALQIDQEKKRQGGSSTMPDGRRSLYNRIWYAPVPSKIRVFTWRLSQEGLTTQSNRKQRILTKISMCQICGMGDEDGHHAVVLCTKVKALRSEMRKHWLLPEETQLGILDLTG
jgi:hypothetical protein